MGNDQKIDDPKLKRSETSLDHKHDYFKIMLEERPTSYLSSPRLLLVNTPKPTLRSLAILVATKIQQTKKKIALSIYDYFKIVSYLSEQFLMQFDLGWS